MKNVGYRGQWVSPAEGERDRKKILRLARNVAHSFMDRYLQRGEYESDYIDLLCEMGTAFSEAVLNEPASSALFEIIVEQLCDRFEQRHSETYNKVMAQVVSFCCGRESGRRIAERLQQFGMEGEKDIISRASAVQQRSVRWDSSRPVERVYILSRVTIGADVAIVSVLVQRLRDLFDGAQIVILGDEKLKEIFDCGSKVRVRAINYPRRSGILDRFESWLAVMRILDEDGRTAGGDFLVIDPDSRISQLGVLPLERMDRYLFLNTRRDDVEDGKWSMAQITNRWVDETFGESGFRYPRVWLSGDAMRTGRALMRKIRQDGPHRITAINLGVGGNRSKRLGAEFEKRLLLELLADPETVIVLDEGFGSREHLTSSKLLAAAGGRGHSTAKVSFGDFSAVGEGTRVIAVRCGIGEMAALIAGSDDYIGYDSAFQHIAAALRVPSVTVFAGTNNPRFIRRWSAYGDTASRIVHVNTLSGSGKRDYEQIVERVVQERASIGRATGV